MGYPRQTALSLVLTHERLLLSSLATCFDLERSGCAIRIILLERYDEFYTYSPDTHLYRASNAYNISYF